MTAARTEMVATFAPGLRSPDREAHRDRVAMADKYLTSDL